MVGVSSANRAVRVFAAGLLAALALAGCGGLESAAAAGTTRDDLPGDLAAQLAKSGELTYTATYQLAGGTTATIAQAQSPARSAFRWPGAKVVVTDSEITKCSRARCAALGSSTDFLDAAAKGGMVLPETVLALLNAASLDTEKTVRQHDTTIAGHHASCAELSGVNGAAASTFSVCVTNEGLLGSFTGTIADTEVDAAMTRYSATTDVEAFAARL